MEEHGDTIYDLTKVLKAAEAGGGEGALKGFGEARRSGSRAQLKRDRGITDRDPFRRKKFMR